MINNIKAFGKFLDQPILISKLDKSMPKILGTAGAIFTAHKAYDTFVKNENKDKKKFFKETFVLATSIASALLAPKIASKILKRPQGETIKAIKNTNGVLIENFLETQKPDAKIFDVLIKAKEKILNPKEIKTVLELNKTKEGAKFVENLIPSPKNIKAKDIFSEIGYLSVYGAIPVVGGVLGGICADKIAKDENKESTKNKIDEGIYQYLANIFMCNIGAGVALGLLEKAKIKSRSARAIAMTCGIIATGVLGGSKMANCISEKIISPLLFKGEKTKQRKPQAMDVCLHTDDIATVSMLSGLKWIEPMLPVLYSVSGYKAGTGYRN